MNYYIINSSNITSQNDVLACMGSHSDHTKIRRSISGNLMVVKCECSDPATQHVGTYLAGKTNYTNEQVRVELLGADWYEATMP